MLAPNTVLQGRYTIVSKIAEGGMGAVYLAHYGSFKGRYVAVKQAKIDRSNQTLRRQFEKEATLLFYLKHGALPKVFDVFSEPEGEFLVMEYIEGKDLAHVLEENAGPIEVSQFLRRLK